MAVDLSQIDLKKLEPNPALVEHARMRRESVENRIADRTECAKTLRQHRSRIISSGLQYAEVQRVAKRIEAVAVKDKPRFVWKVTLLRKNEANAYCLPGGKIVVYSGILPITRNAAGLATVLGHEVSHATAELVAERIERQHLTEIAAAILAGGVAFTPAQYLRVMALVNTGRRFPSAAGRSPKPITSGWSTWPGRDTTRTRPRRSGSACSGRRRERAAGVPERSSERRAPCAARRRLAAGGRARISVDLTPGAVRKRGRRARCGRAARTAATSRHVG